MQIVNKWNMFNDAANNEISLKHTAEAAAAASRWTVSFVIINEGERQMLGLTNPKIMN